MSKGLGEQLTYSGSSLDARETIILQEGLTVDGVITNISNAYPGLKVKVIERLEKSDFTGELTSSKIYEIKKTSNRNKPLPASQGGYELIKEPRDLKYSDGTSFLNENGNINSDTKLIEISDKIDKLPSGMYYGQYSSVENLPTISSLEQKGYAYVSTIEPNVYYIYLYNGDGEEWQDSGNKFVTTELETNLSTKSQTKAPTTKIVAEGIEAVNVTVQQSFTNSQKETARTNIGAQENITAMQDIQPVVAALNNRAADVVPVTNEVKALGYKVLNSSLGFAEQVGSTQSVNNSNMVFEIRDEFDLGTALSLTKDAEAVTLYKTDVIVGANDTLIISSGDMLFNIDGNKQYSLTNNKFTPLKTTSVTIVSTSDTITYKKGIVTLAESAADTIVLPEDTVEFVVCYPSTQGVSLATGEAIKVESCLVLNENKTKLLSLNGRYYTATADCIVYPAAIETENIECTKLGKVTIASNSVLKFNGGKIKNAVINLNNAKIEAPLTQVFKDVLITKSYSAQTVHTTWFGMTSTTTSGNYHNSEIFEMVINAFMHIVVEDGTYQMECSVELKTAEDTRPTTIMGSRARFNYTPIFVFEGSLGFELNKSSIINGISVKGIKGTWNVSNSTYEGGTVGIQANIVGVIEYCRVADCAIGLSVNAANTVYGDIKHCLFESCGKYGIFQYSVGTAYGTTINPLTTNVLTIEKCYFVNIGYEAGIKNATKPSTGTSCVGLYIKGGSGNNYMYNVFEYGSGTGIYVDAPTVKASTPESPIRRESLYKGNLFFNNYFEYNRYAQFIINLGYSDNTYMNNIVVLGNSYSDNSFTPVSNAIPYRRLVLINPFARGGSNDNNIFIPELKSYIDTVFDYGRWNLSIINGNIPYYLKAYDIANSALKIGSGATMDEKISIPVKPGVYKLEANVKKMSGTSRYCSITVFVGTNSSAVFGVYTDNTTSFQDKIAFKQINGNWSTQPFMAIKEETTIKITSIYLSSGTNADSILIKRIFLQEYNSGSTTTRNSITDAPTGYVFHDTTLNKDFVWNGTAWQTDYGDSTERPNGANVGFRYYDTTLGKPIYWDGLSWIDGDGNYIFDNSGSLQNRLALTSPIKGQQFKLTREGETDVYLIYGDYGWLNATNRSPWFDDSGYLNAMYDKYNYVLLTEEPSTWATTYNTYYKIVDGVYTKLTTLETWALDTYYEKDVNAYKGIQVKLTDDDTDASGSLTNRIVKWNGTKYINIVDNVALKAGIPEITFATENNITTAIITSTTSSGKIYYTKNGDNPTSSSTEYSSAITLADGDQVKAICIRDHMDNSGIGFVKVATPVVSFNSDGILAITCGTADAKIYYTIDGSAPSTASTEYDSSASVTIAKGVIVNAIAVLIGRVNSEKGFKKRS